MIAFTLKTLYAIYISQLPWFLELNHRVQTKTVALLVTEAIHVVHP